MKKLVLITLLLLSPTITAQEREVWTCESNESAGFSFIGNEWVKQEVHSEYYLLTVDGSNSNLRNNGLDMPMECVTNLSFYSCSNFTDLFVLKSTTGRAGYSTVNGIVQNGDGSDSIAAAVLQCTRF